MDQDLRQSGVGRALVRAAEQHAKNAGFTEIASDCVLDNEVSCLGTARWDTRKLTDRYTFASRLAVDSRTPRWTGSESSVLVK